MHAGRVLKFIRRPRRRRFMRMPLMPRRCWRWQLWLLCPPTVVFLGYGLVLRYLYRNNYINWRTEVLGLSPSGFMGVLSGLVCMGLLATCFVPRYFRRRYLSLRKQGMLPCANCDYPLHAGATHCSECGWARSISESIWEGCSDLPWGRGSIFIRDPFIGDAEVRPASVRASKAFERCLIGLGIGGICLTVYSVSGFPGYQARQRHAAHRQQAAEIGARSALYTQLHRCMTKGGECPNERYRTLVAEGLLPCANCDGALGSDETKCPKCGWSRKVCERIWNEFMASSAVTAVEKRGTKEARAGPAGGRE